MDQAQDPAYGMQLRADLPECHRTLLAHLSAAGTWWSGTERRAIAEESRLATDCGLCQRRKDALSPGAVTGSHDAAGHLEPAIVDVIHRIRTDPARLSRPWFDRTVPALLPDTHYVELVSVVALVSGLDYFARALGTPRLALPQPGEGTPSCDRPPAAKQAGAWVPMLAPEDAVGPDADLYPPASVVPNIMRALSLVPDEVRALRRLVDTHYLPVEKVLDPTARRSIDRTQMELVAARISALNECFY